jgi:hypothetical protein
MHTRLRERGHLSDQRLSSGALGIAEAVSDYFSSDKHYASLARRIVAALRCGGHWVLITGDPPADPQALCAALGNVAGLRHDVIIISCGPELTRTDLERAAAIVTGQRATPGAVAPEVSVATFPLFVFDNFDQLSDKQIEEVHKATLDCGPISAPGILLASLDFLLRLEQPPLRFFKEHLAAQFRVQDVGDDEAITFLHHQLLTQRDRRIEERGFRHGIVIGVAGFGVALAASIGLFLMLNRAAEPVRAAPESTEQRRASEAGSRLLPPEEQVSSFDVAKVPKTETGSPSATTPPQPPGSTIAEGPLPIPQIPGTRPPAEERVTDFESAHADPKSETRSASETTPPQPQSFAVVESAPPVAQSATQQLPADLHTADAQIAALVARGDQFLKSGDITSARLFYERAADAGSGPAALQLGATFDPAILGQARTLGVIADPAQALLWYRRARELGIVEAEQRIKRFETSSLRKQDTRSH